jgi:hypothetical protein
MSRQVPSGGGGGPEGPTSGGLEGSTGGGPEDPQDDPWWTPAVPHQELQDPEAPQASGSDRPRAGEVNRKGVAAIAAAVVLATLAVGALVRTAGQGGGGATAGDAAPAVATNSPATTTTTTVVGPGRSGPAAPPAGTPASIGGVGTSASIGRNGATLGAITLARVGTATQEPGDLATKPRNGMFLVVTVQLTAVGDGFGPGPSDFYVRAPDGTRHQSTATPTQPWGPELRAGVRLARGLERQGVMVYDVSDRHGELVYAPVAGARRPVAVWRF